MKLLWSLLLEYMCSSLSAACFSILLETFFYIIPNSETHSYPPAPLMTTFVLSSIIKTDRTLLITSFALPHNCLPCSCVDPPPKHLGYFLSKALYR